MQESGLIEIIPLICILTILGQYPVFLCPEFPSVGPTIGVAAVAGNIHCLLEFFFFVHSLDNQQNNKPSPDL